MSNEKDNLKKEVEELNKKLQELERLNKEYLAGWQRATADLINYKNEEMERIQGFIKIAKERLLFEMLPILDSFDIAENNIPKELKENDNIKGLIQIKKQLTDFLRKNGIEEIKSIGEKFDPRYHEVMEEVEKENVEKGVIIEEIQKGYKIGDRVFRPAKVKIAK